MSESTGSILRRYALAIYGPTSVFSLGEGAVVPLVPVMAAARGADIALSALVSGAVVVGQVCGNIPAGWAVSRIGEQRTMAISAGIAIVAALGILFAPGVWPLAASVFMLGICTSAFALARHSFLATRVSLAFRARALSMLGAAFRLGSFVGPFVAAGLLAIFGDERAAVWALLGCLLVVVVFVTLGPDPERAIARTPVDDAVELVLESEDTGEAVTGVIPVRRHGVFRTMWRNRGVLSRLGLSSACLSAVRAARTVVLPLWGVSIGLDGQTIAILVGIASAVDFVLSYASGQVMDRFGRLWAALPAMILMGGGLALLAATADAGAASVWFVVVALLVGIGNGLSSGVLLTIGADTAPRGDPAPYLGSWRTLTDAGGAATPLIVAGIAALFTLPIATGVIGALGLLGALGFQHWLPRYIPNVRGSGRR